MNYATDSHVRISTEALRGKTMIHNRNWKVMNVRTCATCKRPRWLIVCGMFLLWAAVALPAQTFTLLQSFDGYDGYGSEAALVQGTDGNFYGDTINGSVFGEGNVYKTTPSGTVTSLHMFSSSDGVEPVGALVLDTNGKFYGTTSYSGSTLWGSVFSITSGGTVTTVHGFVNSDGAYPEGPIVQASNGSLYGICRYAGPTGYGGTIFEITPAGTFNTFYAFAEDGGSTPLYGLIQGTDGSLYGISQSGGLGYGGIYKVDQGATLTLLYSLTNGSDGSGPQGPLVQAANGNFYGTTSGAGVYGYGTVFGMSPTGTLHTLHSFDSTEGANPAAGLIQATDGNFYGTTSAGGANGNGTIFQMTPTGTLTTLHNFDGTDGNDAQAPLVQGTDGNFYGTTYTGGASNIGTIFNESVGLGPFVRTNPTSGAAGKTVKILGNNLTGSTSVTFNRVEAAFTIASNSAIIATVPAGATTGTVQVTAPGGTLNSNIVFRVRP